MKHRLFNVRNLLFAIVMMDLGAITMVAHPNGFVTIMQRT
jgi:hypothetical protein